MKIPPYVIKKQKWIIPIILLMLVLMAIVSYYSMAQIVATNQQIEDDPGILLTAPNNSKVERLQEKLDSANCQNKYLKNITPLVIIKPVDDVAKIQVLQDKIDTLNKLNIDKTVYENINSNYADETYPIYVFEPVEAPPKANILKQVMAGKGSYTELYERAQREGK
jgi:hypothetical protein